MMNRWKVRNYAYDLGWTEIEDCVFGLMFGEIIDTDGGDDEKAKAIVRKWHKANEERHDRMLEYAKSAYYESPAYMRDLRVSLFGCDEAAEIEKENGRDPSWVERYRK